jgi:hypothetical protein
MTTPLNWYINEDHFEAQTEFGTYTVGDWGSGQAFVNLPGNGHEIVPFATGKDVAQADYDNRTAVKA